MKNPKIQEFQIVMIDGKPRTYVRINGKLYWLDGDRLQEIPIRFDPEPRI